MLQMGPVSRRSLILRHMLIWRRRPVRARNLLDADRNKSWSPQRLSPSHETALQEILSRQSGAQRSDNRNI